MNIASWYELSTSAGRASTKICSCHKWVTIEVEIKFFPRSIWVLGSWAPTRIRVPSLNWKLQVSKTSFYEVFLSYVYNIFFGKWHSFISLLATVSFFLRIIYWNKYEGLNSFLKVAERNITFVEGSTAGGWRKLS